MFEINIFISKQAEKEKKRKSIYKMKINVFQDLKMNLLIYVWN